MINSFDLFVFHAFNGLAGNWTFDRLANFEETNDLLKGALLLALYFFFWFREGTGQEERRLTIISVVAGAFLALVVNRALAAGLPFRVRPMYMGGIGYREPSIAVNYNLENWSSFPSDMATYFFALAFGLVYFARRLALMMMAYTIVVIFVPRLYLGIHFASDIIAGALIGAVGVWAMRNRLTDRILGRPILAFGRSHPAAFHMLMFLIAFEMAVIFMHVRHAAHGLMAVVGHYGLAVVQLHLAALVLGLGLAAIAAIGLGLALRGQRRQAPAEQPSSSAADI